jgi:Bacterial Ig-like domain (group 2)
MLTGRKLALELAFTALVAVAFGASCRGFFPKPTLQSVAVGPATPTLQTGSTNNIQQMTAVGTYDDGVRPDSKVTWSIVDVTGTGVATVSAGGLVSAKSQGTASVTATSTEIPTISGSAQVTVTVGCIQSIAVTPTNPFVGVGTSKQFTAMATTCAGVFDITNVSTWVSSNTAVATIDSSGLASTITTGTTNITASSAGVTSPIQVLTVQ